MGSELMARAEALLWQMLQLWWRLLDEAIIVTQAYHKQEVQGDPRYSASLEGYLLG